MSAVLNTSAQQSDAALMGRIQDDDAEAFGELYDRYATTAFRVARSVCHDSSRAEEAVQEGFLSLWRGRARYRPAAGSVRAWAMSTIRHRAIDLVRREGAARQGTLVELRHTVPDTDSPSPPDAVVALSEAEKLRALMRRLPDAQAEVIALAFFGGLTHSEIAAQLVLPEGTVKGRMRLGMHRLRSDMEDRAEPAG